MAAKLLEVWRGDAGAGRAATERGRAGARRGAAGRGARRSQDGGRRGRAAKTLRPPLPTPPARSAGRGHASGGAGGERRAPKAAPRHGHGARSSAPGWAAGRPGPAVGELKWRTSFSSSPFPRAERRLPARWRTRALCVRRRARPGGEGRAGEERAARGRRALGRAGKRSGGRRGPGPGRAGTSRPAPDSARLQLGALHSFPRSPLLGAGPAGTLQGPGLFLPPNNARVAVPPLSPPHFARPGLCGTPRPLRAHPGGRRIGKSRAAPRGAPGGYFIDFVQDGQRGPGRVRRGPARLRGGPREGEGGGGGGRAAARHGGFWRHFCLGRSARCELRPARAATGAPGCAGLGRHRAPLRCSPACFLYVDLQPKKKKKRKKESPEPTPAADVVRSSARPGTRGFSFLLLHLWLVSPPALRSALCGLPELRSAFSSPRCPARTHTRHPGPLSALSL